MENVVSALINIDMKAAERLDRAKLDGEGRVSAAKKQAAKIRKDMLSQAGSRVEKVQEHYAKLAKEQIAECEIRRADEIAVMDKNWNAKKAEVEEGLYKSVIS